MHQAKRKEDAQNAIKPVIYPFDITGDTIQNGRLISQEI